MKIVTKCVILGLMIATAAAFTGCASVATGRDLNGQKLTLDQQAQDVAHVNVTNWGLYCLWIPLLSGSTDKPGDIAFMQDTVNVNSMVDLATKESKKMGGKKLVDLNSSRSSIWIMPTFVLFLREVQVSGNSVK